MLSCSFKRWLPAILSLGQQFTILLDVTVNCLVAMLCPFAQAWMMIQGAKQQQISLCYLYVTLGKYICFRA